MTEVRVFLSVLMVDNSGWVKSHLLHTNLSSCRMVLADPELNEL